jgi:hypothetical protein
MNVRAFAFRPNTDPAVITGLVTWDGLDFADRYEVTVMEDGMPLQNVSVYCMWTHERAPPPPLQALYPFVLSALPISAPRHFLCHPAKGTQGWKCVLPGDGYYLHCAGESQ